MTKDEIIKLAREAAAKHGHTLREVPQTETVELLVEFYTMATALAILHGTKSERNPNQ